MVIFHSYVSLPEGSHWVIQKKGLERLKSWICSLRWWVKQKILEIHGNTWYLWKYHHLIFIYIYLIYRKWYLEDLTRNTYHISIIIGMQVKRSHLGFTGQLPQWNCQGTSEAWTAPAPCAPPGCPARHSCGKLAQWEVVFVGKITQLLREIDGNWWKLMEFDGFMGASEVGFVHNSFNILQYQNWLMRHWLKPWSQQCWHWWWFQHVSTSFRQKIGYLTNDGYFTSSFTGSIFLLHPTPAPTLGNPLLFGSPASIPWAKKDCLQAAKFGCFPAQTVIENSNSSFPHL